MAKSCKICCRLQYTYVSGPRDRAYWKKETNKKSKKIKGRDERATWDASKFKANPRDSVSCSRMSKDKTGTTSA